MGFIGSLLLGNLTAKLLPHFNNVHMIMKIKPELDKIEFNLPDGRTSNELLAKQGKEIEVIENRWSQKNLGHSDTQISIFVGELTRKNE